MSAHKRANAKRAEIDRDLPHQVALLNDLCCMENFTTIRKFCERFAGRVETTSVTAIWPNDTRAEFRLYCFATREEAEVFADHFEGDHFNPKDRGKGVERGVWLRFDSWEYKDRSGPLRVPKFFAENP
jgi:hypothetical protein